MFHRIAVVLALVLSSTAFAQSNTARFKAPYGNTENGNRALDQFDKGPLGSGIQAITYCGQQANAGTVFMATGAKALLDPNNYVRFVGDATCDTHGTDPSESVANQIISAQVGVRAIGMCCQVETTPGAVVTFTARAASADLSPTLTCSVASGGPVHCCASATTISGPKIAANVVTSVKAVDTTNESAVGALCKVYVQPDSF